MIQQTKTLPASQVQNNFGAIVNQVRRGEVKEVIVENRGKPVAAIVDMEELQAMREFREQEKRKKALNLLREARKEVQDRLTKKLTDEEAMELADRFSRELIEDLAKTGKVKFERKRT
jgi:prevent-host-death family protein